MLFPVLHVQPRSGGDGCASSGIGRRHPIVMVSYDSNAGYPGNAGGSDTGNHLRDEKRPMTAAELVYKRARFGTRIPTDRLYTRSHYWLIESEPGVWRVGFTKFATRMLGDIVEYSFDVEQDQAIEAGAKIGWIEGFKAVSDVYAAGQGRFCGSNAELRSDITLIETDPYRRGWLYEVEGSPEPGTVDANGYAAILDATIDRMLASRHDGTADD